MRDAVCRATGLRYTPEPVFEERNGAWLARWTCPHCGRGVRVWVGRIAPPLEEWCFDGVAEALDGCPVEVDGSCPHGLPSWLRALGLV